MSRGKSIGICWVIKSNCFGKTAGESEKRITNATTIMGYPEKLPRVKGAIRELTQIAAD